MNLFVRGMAFIAMLFLTYCECTTTGSYTSPPLPLALSLTPEPFQNNDVMDLLRKAVAAGNCSLGFNDATSSCQIPFVPPPQEEEGEGFFDKQSPVGIIFYGGALVDPRAYSVLASPLTQKYGLPVVIPVFHKDLAFTAAAGLLCGSSGRLALAKADFPHVQKWILVGHSLGGVAAFVDLWAESKGGTDFQDIAGLVMLAAYYGYGFGCGDIDFSATTLPAASVAASLDGLVDPITWEENKSVFPENTTKFTLIKGGNHGQFGCYDDSERHSLLGQTDGQATIPPQEQWDIVITAIHDVALRSGLELPKHIIPDITATVAVMWSLLRFRLLR